MLAGFLIAYKVKCIQFGRWISPRNQGNMAKKNVAENTAVRRFPALFVFVAIVVILAIATYMLYPVARNYYIAFRENTRLEAEYEAVMARNEKIRDQLVELTTPEGIQDRAREEFGWVMEGEEAVNITGLNITESSTGLPASIEPGSVKASDTWWTKFLDFIFGIEDDDLTNPYPDDVIPGL